MNNRITEEGKLLTRICIRKGDDVCMIPVDFRRREINVTLDVIQSRKTKCYVFQMILKVLQANQLARVILYTNSKIKSEYS